MLRDLLSLGDELNEIGHELRRMAAEGQPEELIDFLVNVFGNVPEEPNIVNSTIEKVTGRSVCTYWRELRSRK